LVLTIAVMYLSAGVVFAGLMYLHDPLRALNRNRSVPGVILIGHLIVIGLLILFWFPLTFFAAHLRDKGFTFGD
jgi:hypothetical protein